MDRIIITGANGAGKSYWAARLGGVVSFDAMKLTTHWVQRPRGQIDADLARLVATDRWVIEGGPSLLPLALPRAQVVIWLDPPLWQRAWRLLKRPLRHRGTTRAELPPGNVDRLAEQWRFGWRSLRADAAFRANIKGALAGTSAQIFHCRSKRDAARAISACADR